MAKPAPWFSAARFVRQKGVMDICSVMKMLLKVPNNDQNWFLNSIFDCFYHAVEWNLQFGGHWVEYQNSGENWHCEAWKNVCLFTNVLGGAREP